MSLRVALAWLHELHWGGRLLGLWRSVKGPGPWSLYLLADDGTIIEAWAITGGSLVGKRLSSL